MAGVVSSASKQSKTCALPPPLPAPALAGLGGRHSNPSLPRKTPSPVLDACSRTVQDPLRQMRRRGPVLPSPRPGVRGQSHQQEGRRPAGTLTSRALGEDSGHPPSYGSRSVTLTRLV